MKDYENETLKQTKRFPGNLQFRSVLHITYTVSSSHHTTKAMNLEAAQHMRARAFHWSSRCATLNATEQSDARGQRFIAGSLCPKFYSTDKCISINMQHWAENKTRKGSAQRVGRCEKLKLHKATSIQQNDY